MSLLRRCTPALDDFCATHCGLSSAVARSSSTNKELLGCLPFDEPRAKPERCEFYKATRTSHHHSLKRELERCEYYANNQSSSSHVLCAEDPLTLDAAQAVASRSRLAIAFLVRDAAEYIERNLWALAHLGSNFAAWRLYYLENDSTDDTRRLLDGFRNKFPMHVAGLMMDGASTQPSAFLCPPIFSKLNCLERTGLLAALRQRLLTFVLHDPTHGIVAAHGWLGNDDAILMLDIDFVSFSAANYMRSFAMARQHSAAAVFASSTYKGKFARLEVYDSAAVVPRLSAKSTTTRTVFAAHAFHKRAATEPICCCWRSRRHTLTSASSLEAFMVLCRTIATLPSIAHSIQHLPFRTRWRGCILRRLIAST